MVSQGKKRRIWGTAMETRGIHSEWAELSRIDVVILLPGLSTWIPGTYHPPTQIHTCCSCSTCVFYVPSSCPERVRMFNRSGAGRRRRYSVCEGITTECRPRPDRLQWGRSAEGPV